MYSLDTLWELGVGIGHRLGEKIFFCTVLPAGKHELNAEFRERARTAARDLLNTCTTQSDRKWTLAAIRTGVWAAIREYRDKLEIPR